MKRRWFGVALALWAVVAPLFAIVSAPVAHADNEQFTFDTVFQNGQLYYMIRGINGAFKSGAELRSPVGSPNIGGLPPGKNVPNTYSSSAALGALDGGCGQMQITNVNPSGTAGVFTATLQYSSSTCAIAQGAIKVFDPNNALGTGSANYTPPAGTGAAGTDPKPECDSGPATFLVCDWLIKPGLWLIDWVQKNIIIPFLQEKPLNNKDADVQPVYAIWSAFRNVASIFFILVFFLVIFGTAIGWDNYTIKKILPRLIAGAILVPFSWFICVIVIDIGNVIGQGLVSLMSSIIPAPKIDFNTPLSSIFLDSALLGVGALAIGFAFTTLSLGVIISVLLAILATFLTLVLRKVFILLLVVLSPFALLAWILPNTTKWFKEWWTNFFKLVMM